LSTCRWVKEKGGTLGGINCSQAGYNLNRCRNRNNIGGVYQGAEDDAIFWFDLGEKEGKEGSEFIPPDDPNFEYDYKHGYEYGLRQMNQMQSSGNQGTEDAFNQGYEAGMSQCECSGQIVPEAVPSIDFTTWLGGGSGPTEPVGGNQVIPSLVGKKPGSYRNGDPLPSWLTPPGFDQLTTSAVTTYVNPITGETYETSSGGYTVNVGGDPQGQDPDEQYYNRFNGLPLGL
jgi:hypothetical protein